MGKVITVLLLFFAGAHAEAMKPGAWGPYYTPTIHAILAAILLLYGCLRIFAADRSRR